MATGDLYIYDQAGNVTPTPDVKTWAAWYEQASRLIGYQETPTMIVATIFLSVDPGYSDPPALFQTDVFQSPQGGMQWWFATKIDAQTSHGKIVAAINAGTDLQTLDLPAVANRKLPGPVRPGNSTLGGRAPLAGGASTVPPV
jgi:hypothetical protein